MRKRQLINHNKALRLVEYTFGEHRRELVVTEFREDVGLAHNTVYHNIIIYYY